MEKKQFKAESQRLMDLMINSIYTHKEIFLREIISNASDAIDKLAYKALTDEKVGLNREDFKIVVTPDKDERTLTVSDNGIGMTQEEMENNLGTIAKSGSLQFKKENENADDAVEVVVELVGGVKSLASYKFFKGYKAANAENPDVMDVFTEDGAQINKIVATAERMCAAHPECDGQWKIVTKSEGRRVFLRMIAANLDATGKIRG